MTMRANWLHSVMNCEKHSLQVVLVGKRGMGDNVKEYCKVINIHSSFLNYTTKPHYKMPSHVLVNWLNCRQGCQNQWQVKHIYQQNDFMRGTAVIDVFCTLMHNILFSNLSVCCLIFFYCIWHV